LGSLARPDDHVAAVLDLDDHALVEQPSPAMLSAAKVPSAEPPRFGTG